MAKETEAADVEAAVKAAAEAFPAADPAPEPEAAPEPESTPEPEAETETGTSEGADPEPEAEPRKRGRPPGAKNKPKADEDDIPPRMRKKKPAAKEEAKEEEKKPPKPNYRMQDALRNASERERQLVDKHYTQVLEQFMPEMGPLIPICSNMALHLVVYMRDALDPNVYLSGVGAAVPFIGAHVRKAKAMSEGAGNPLIAVPCPTCKAQTGEGCKNQEGEPLPPLNFHSARAHNAGRSQA